MKQLGKIRIDTERIIKDSELVVLRGGYSPHDPPCYYECHGDGKGECYDPCPRCSDIPGYPYHKLCTSP